MSDEPTNTDTVIPGSQPPEPVEDRPNVGTVNPRDYPDGDRAAGVSDPPSSGERQHERLKPDSEGQSPAKSGGGHDRGNA